jgi:hypothetical protein
MLSTEDLRKAFNITLDFCNKNGFNVFCNHISSYNKYNLLINSICDIYKINTKQLFNKNIKNNDAMKMLCFILYFDYSYNMPLISRLIKYSKSAIRINIDKAQFYMLNPKTNPEFITNYKLIINKINNNE